MPERDLTCSAVTELRKALGLTQQQFAKEFNIALRTVARWESEKPPDSALFDLAKFAESKEQTEAAAFFYEMYWGRVALRTSERPVGPQANFPPQSGRDGATGILPLAVRELRLALGKTQQEFANAIGTTLGTISRWETGSTLGIHRLTQLGSLAQDSGLHKLHHVFSSESVRLEDEEKAIGKLRLIMRRRELPAISTRCSEILRMISSTADMLSDDSAKGDITE